MVKKSESTKTKNHETRMQNRQHAHEKEMALLEFFTQNKDAPFIAMMFGGLGVGMFANLLGTYFKNQQIKSIDLTDDDYKLMVNPDGTGRLFTDAEIAKLQAGGGVLKILPRIFPGNPPLFEPQVRLVAQWITEDFIKRKIMLGQDPSQTDDVMGTFGGGVAGFGASVLLIRSIFGEGGAQGTGSVIAAASIVGLGTALTAAYVGKVAD